MSEAKHTPGPWKAVYYSGDNNRPTVVRKVSGRADNPVCVIAKLFTHHGETETEANARLIATAPELLAACKAVVDAWHANDSNFERELNKGTPTWLAEARAAIAKATGTDITAKGVREP